MIVKLQDRLKVDLAVMMVKLQDRLITEYLFQTIHDEELKREFESSNSYRRAAFEDEFIRYAESMLNEVDKRIRKGKQRLALSVKEALVSFLWTDVGISICFCTHIV